VEISSWRFSGLFWLILAFFSQIYSELGDEIADDDKQWTAMSCLLLRHGADLNRANGKGERPIDYVNSHGLRTALMASLPRRDRPTNKPASLVLV